MFNYLFERFSKEKISSILGLVIALVSSMGYLSGPDVAAIHGVMTIFGFDMSQASSWSAIAGVILILFPTSYFRGKNVMPTALTFIMTLSAVTFSVSSVWVWAADLNYEYQAIAEAERILVEQGNIGCLNAKAVTARKPTVGVIETYGKEKVVYVNGARLRVSCNKFAIASPIFEQPIPTEKGVLLTWNASTKRMNGAALLPGEIARYEILVSDGSSFKVIATTLDTKYEVKPLMPGTYTYALRTVDTQGQISPLSESVTVTVL